MVSQGSALSVFSGIGGLDLGAQMAGVRVELATDVDGEALVLLAAALGVRTETGSISNLLAGGELQRAWGDLGRPRILFGGPPCTPFSHAGFWLDGKRNGLDPARHHLTSYMECVRAFEPDAFVLENVPGLTFKTHRRSLDELIREANTAGYAVSSAILRASDFGVAQHRRRLFVAGIRGGPAADMGTWPRWPIRNSRWAIGDLQSGEPEPDELPGERYRELLTLVPSGSNYLHFTAPRGWDPPLFKYRGRYWSFLLKLDPGRPSPTLPAQRITYNGPFHWANRHLRIREIARLQGFPDWYALSPNVSHARRHVGNAVPPLLAAAVIWRVRQTLGDVSPSDWPVAFRTLADADASWTDVNDGYPTLAHAAATA